MFLKKKNLVTGLFALLMVQSAHGVRLNNEECVIQGGPGSIGEFTYTLNPDARGAATTNVAFQIQDSNIQIGTLSNESMPGEVQGFFEAFNGKLGGFSCPDLTMECPRLQGQHFKG